MLSLKNSKGFTLIEVIVVAGIIAILAGILVPLIFNQVDEAKVARAQGDMKSIQNSIMLFKKDTSIWPNKTADPAVPVTLLMSDAPILGDRPKITAKGWNFSTEDRIINHLRTDTDGLYGASWKGPYMGTADADPWGNAYVINADQFTTTGPLWIVSAGPDGVVQTDALADQCSDKNNTTPADDICLRLK